MSNEIYIKLRDKSGKYVEIELEAFKDAARKVLNDHIYYYPYPYQPSFIPYCQTDATTELTFETYTNN